MRRRHVLLPLIAALALSLASCGSSTSPKASRSVSGSWSGTSQGLTLNLVLAEGTGVEIDGRGFVKGDEWMRTGVDGGFAVGDLVAADARCTAGWYVVDLSPNEALVLQMADLNKGQPAQRAQRPGWEFLWTFALRPDGDGATRLLVRERVGFANTAVRLLFAPVGVVSFVMTRRMLLGVKTRVEAARGRARAPGRRPPRRIARTALRLPLRLYRWHLGRLLGGRFVLLEHRGRRTGTLHHTVLEVVDHDETFTRVVVCAGWGEQADWYRNVIAHRDVCFETAGVRRSGTARRLDRADAVTVLERYGRAHPRALRLLARRFLPDVPATGGAAAVAEQMAAVLPVVELTAA